MDLAFQEHNRSLNYNKFVVPRYQKLKLMFLFIESNYMRKSNQDLA